MAQRARAREKLRSVVVPFVGVFRFVRATRSRIRRAAVNSIFLWLIRLVPESPRRVSPDVQGGTECKGRPGWGFDAALTRWGTRALPGTSLAHEAQVPRFIRIYGTNAMEMPSSIPWQAEVHRRPRPVWGDAIPIASTETGY